MKQTAVEWLIEQIKKEHPFWTSIFEQAKEMEKQQIKDAYNKSFELRDKPYSTADKYYNETYGSKGSDNHIVDTNKMVGQVPDVRKMVDDDKETFLLWVRRNYERCKTGWIDLETGNKHRIEPDLVYEYYQLHPTFSQTEISDEEIENCVGDGMHDFYKGGFIEGAKWYREQLKQRQ